ncbi:MFS transporter [Methylomonas sp. EFPC1]|uniref:MFS transporter n=1 Tax=Methylomonas defluvii TaxID=3045149 RepID=A0ABU4UD35_9GAMM|nr:MULTISPECIES: MFS transporter [unclassified Methylomonas]MDX8127341.1 MFS transporter [Methylomonas sp. OY6]QSB02327.1 MFS transporter [Methylomonas sp. EFPC1]
MSHSNDPYSETRRLFNIFSGSVGNLVEYFDWAIYAAFALYFAPAFFPETDQTAQLLNNAAIFAVGFIFRPLGGWLLGSLADRKGRKSALLLSVSLMCLGSLIIACTPGYAVIGMWAPALLLFARMLQGFSIGGEYGSSATYLSEMAAPERRGYYSSFQYVTIVLGQILALGLLMLLQKCLLSSAELHDWGWRIGFIVGGLLAVVAMGLRGNMAETTAFVEQQTFTGQRAQLRELLNYPKPVMTVVALTAGGTLSYYTFTVYMQKYLVNTTGFSKDDATTICTLALIVFMLLQPLFGLISDYLGRRTMLIAFGAGATLFTTPLLDLLGHAQTMASALGWYVCALLIVSGYSSVNAIVKAELFPVHIRALGVGFPYALTVAIFGGTAEYLALWLKSLGHAEWFAYYVSACAAVSMLVAFTMKEPMRLSRLDG